MPSLPIPSRPEPVTDSPTDPQPASRPSSSLNTLHFVLTYAGFQDMLEKNNAILLKGFQASNEIRLNNLEARLKSDMQELRDEMKETGKSSTNSISKLGDKLGDFFVSACIFVSSFLLRFIPQSGRSRQSSRNPSPSHTGEKEYME